MPVSCENELRESALIFHDCREMLRSEDIRMKAFNKMFATTVVNGMSILKKDSIGSAYVIPKTANPRIIECNKNDNDSNGINHAVVAERPEKCRCQQQTGV